MIAVEVGRTHGAHGGRSYYRTVDWCSGAHLVGVARLPVMRWPVIVVGTVIPDIAGLDVVARLVVVAVARFYVVAGLCIVAWLVMVVVSGSAGAIAVVVEASAGTCRWLLVVNGLCVVAGACSGALVVLVCVVFYG